MSCQPHPGRAAPAGRVADLLEVTAAADFYDRRRAGYPATALTFGLSDIGSRLGRLDERLQRDYVALTIAAWKTLVSS